MPKFEHRDARLLMCQAGDGSDRWVFVAQGSPDHIVIVYGHSGGFRHGAELGEDSLRHFDDEVERVVRDHGDFKHAYTTQWYADETGLNVVDAFATLWLAYLWFEGKLSVTDAYMLTGCMYKHNWSGAATLLRNVRA